MTSPTSRTRSTRSSRPALTEETYGHALNVGGLEPVSLLEVARLCQEVAGAGGTVETMPWPPEREKIDIGSIYVDHARLTELTGWEPQRRPARGARGDVRVLPRARRALPGVRFLRALFGLARQALRAPREARLARRDRRVLASLRGHTDLRINVGSSSAALDGWINVDLLRDPEGRCLRLDASQPWPFDEGSAEAVNSEHFIEHLSEDEAQAYLREAFRVLRHGGVIRTSTPNLAGIARSLVERGESDLVVHRSHGYTAATHGELVNNYVYSWGHRRLYDEETLARMLERAGFVEPRSCSYGASEHEILRGIDRHDPSGLEHFVLCVEAVKPV